MDAMSEFRDAVESIGLIPSELTPDGILKRCGTVDKPHSKNGWHVFYSDPWAGAYGDWATGFTKKWCPGDNGGIMDPDTRQRINQAIKENKQAREAEQEKKYKAAAIKSQEIIESLPDATAGNPYLKRKGVKPCEGLKADGGILVVPVYGPDSHIMSLQYIKPDLKKEFLPGGKTKGGYFHIKGGAGALYISEGIATSISIYEATGGTVLTAFNCNNLESVALMARKQYQEREIIIAGDDDRQTEIKTGKNPGKVAAEAAARAVGGKVVLPSFLDPEGKSDFNDMFIEQGIKKVRKALEQVKEPEPAAIIENWPDPLPLPDGLPPVAPFDFALLPEALKPWATDIVERMQCPPDFVAVPLMCALGAVIGRKVGIRPQASTDWTVTANTWALLIGRPGVIKSPAMESALSPMKRLVAKAVEKYNEEVKQYEISKIANKLRAEAAEKAARAALKNDPDANIKDLLTTEQEETPILKRYIANDTTAAALGELHRQNPNGLLVFRDELVSLLKMLDQQENSEARGFYLTGWNGDSPYTFDRISRGMNLYIPATCISLLGSTQPGRIGQYVRATLTGGDSDDGLLQRFGLVVWPDTTPSWKEVDRWPDDEAKRKAFKVFERLDKLDALSIGAQQDKGIDGEPEGCPYLRFNTDGLGLFREWRQDLETKLRSGDLHAALESHFSKYRKLVPGLALIIHLSNGDIGPVGKQAVLMALAWAEYLETHAQRLYASVIAPEVETAKRILKKIKTGNLSAVLTVRQIWRPQWTGLTDLDMVKSGVKLLEDFGYFIKNKKSTGGRHLEEYEVNPKVQGLI